MDGSEDSHAIAGTEVLEEEVLGHSQLVQSSRQGISLLTELSLTRQRAIHTSLAWMMDIYSMMLKHIQESGNVMADLLSLFLIQLFVFLVEQLAAIIFHMSFCLFYFSTQVRNKQLNI